MLRSAIKRSFCLINAATPNRPVQERVMTTSSWPVPYYKRISKAYPAKNARKFNIEVGSFKVTEMDVIQLKNKLEMDPNTKQIVFGYENNVKTNGKFHYINLHKLDE